MLGSAVIKAELFQTSSVSHQLSETLPYIRVIVIPELVDNVTAGVEDGVKILDTKDTHHVPPLSSACVAIPLVELKVVTEIKLKFKLQTPIFCYLSGRGEYSCSTTQSPSLS